MRRPEEYSTTRWDDPFWHVVRMLVDETRGKVLEEQEILAALIKIGTPASNGLQKYISTRNGLAGRLAGYTAYRSRAADVLLGLCRTEAEALDDFAQISDEVVARYGTQSADHHQSSKVVVKTVEVLSQGVCRGEGLIVDVNPQKRAVVISGEHIWVSPRRLDGALPSLLNPVGLWEIKEYWGGTSGGSKMSDAIYECQLVGQELRSFEDRYDIRVRHYAILDGRQQWSTRRSDLRRAVDLLCMGLLDELIVGSEIITDWPRIVRDMCNIVKG